MSVEATQVPSMLGIGNLLGAIVCAFVIRIDRGIGLRMGLRRSVCRRTICDLYTVILRRGAMVLKEVTLQRVTHFVDRRPLIASGRSVAQGSKGFQARGTLIAQTMRSHVCLHRVIEMQVDNLALAQIWQCQ